MALLAPVLGLALAAGVLGCAPGSEAPASSLRVGDELIEVPVRVYEPAAAEPWATLVWAHGGSFVRGDLAWPEADWVARRFAEAGLRVYSVGYTLASEQVKAPAPSNEIAAVLREVRERHDGPLFIGGASAGGHLATAAALSVLEPPADAAPAAEHAAAARLDALVLVYPTLHRVQRERPEISALTFGLPEQRRFSAERVAEMYDFYFGDADPRTDPSAAVPVGELPPTSLAPLPPTVMVNAEADDLRASGEQFAEQLREAGVRVTVRTQPGTVHGYLNRPEESTAAERDARATIDFAVGELQAILERSRAGSNPDE